MVPLVGGMVQSPSSSGIFFQGDGQSANSRLNSNFVSSSNSLQHPNTFSNSAASSLVTDANSGLSCINSESYMRLPTSPISFSSNNNYKNQGASSSDLTAISQLRKKPHLDIKQEDIVQQEVLQQILQRQGPAHMQNPNPQLQALVQQQQRLKQQEQMLLQGMTPIQRVHFLQQQQLQLRQQQQLQVQGMATVGKRAYDGGVCSRRLMQYLYHQRQRPADNTIGYWRKFVSEYYSPRAKKRWCLSMYDNVGHHSLGVFPQAALDAWQCDICGSKSGRGFETTFEVLPILNEINFSSGVIDELLYLDLPRECRFPSGIMMLEYAKAVHESVYEQLRVVREGQLRILFSPDLKILSWEFCARRHEELLSRRMLAPQVNQLLQVAQKCQSTISECGADGISQPDLKSNSVLVVTAGRQLARSLELQSLNDLGFSKRYVRCLQVADVVNSMKDLMDFCRDHKKGPIEALKNFPRRATAPKTETDQTGLNNLMSLNPGRNFQNNNNYQHFSSRGASSVPSQAVLPLSNYQHLLTRQNSMNSTNSPIQNSRILPNRLLLQQNQSQSSGQALQQQMMQQYLQDMGKKNNGPTVSGPGLGFGGPPANNATGNKPYVVQGQQSSRNNSFKAASSESESPAPGVSSQKGSDLPQSHYLSEKIALDIAGEFSEFFDNDFGFD